MYDSLARPGKRQSAAFLCAALALFALGFAIHARTAHAQGVVTVQGRVLNGTAAAPAGALSNLGVTLFRMTASGPVTRTVTTDAQGSFAFPGVPADSSSPFFVRVDYQSIPYFSDIVTEPITASAPLTITVYETQALPADFQIDRAHLILDVAPRSLSGVELLQLKNATDRVFLLPLPLPENVTDVEFQDPRDQFRAVRAADGSLVFPISPTTDQVLLGVQLAAPPGDYTLRFHTPVKLGRLNLLVAQTGGVTASSSQLTTGAPFSPPQSGTTYSQLNGDNLPAGAAVVVAISNLPGADDSGPVRAAVLGVGGVGALLLLAWPLRRRRRTLETARPYDLAGRTAKGESSQAQLEAIAALDDAFEAGRLAEDEYLDKRAQLKNELLASGIGNDPDHQA